MTATACPACGGALASWRSVRAGEPADPRRFELLRCVVCGTAVTAGAPPGPEVYEAGVYAPGPPRAAGAVRALQRASVGQPVRMLRRAGLATGARVLDAGAGGGRLVAALRDAGYEASGIEPSERSAKRAEAAGLPVRRATIEEHQTDGLAAVVLWHVLEHLAQPAPALARVAAWLAPGGLVLVGVPNAASLQAGIGGDGWLHWDVPRHRTHFTPAGLDALMAGTGLRRQRAAHWVWEHNPAAMWMALLSRLGAAPGLPFHLLKRNLRPRAKDLALLGLAGPPLLPAAALLEAGAAALRRGGTVAVVYGAV